MKSKLSVSLLTYIFLMSAHAENGQVPTSLLFLGNGAYYPKYGILVDKTRRLTEVWQQNLSFLSKVKEYTSDFGKEPGDKHVLGDHRTPEGIYFFNTMIEGPSLPYEKYGRRAFTTDYPNLFDKREGKTGSGIWLHAIPDTESLERGSRGCVVIRNKSIMEISSYISLERTPFLIHEQIEFVPKVVHNEIQQKIVDFLAAWKASWENENIDSYMNYYSKSFYSNRKDWNGWKDYKAGLSEVYNEISVKFSKPFAFKHKNEYIVKLLQAYSSDSHSDFGEKILHIKHEEDGFKIVAEHWKSVNDKYKTEIYDALVTSNAPSKRKPSQNSQN